MDTLLWLTNAVNFVGVALGLWLGFFSLTRSPQHTLTRVAALTLWGCAFFFLSNLMFYNLLRERTEVYWVAIFRVSTLFVPAFWMHLTSTLLPDAEERRLAPLMAGAYVIATGLTIYDSANRAFLSAVNPQGEIVASTVEGWSRAPGPALPIYIAYMTGCAAVASRNLIAALRLAGTPVQRRLIRRAIGGTTLAGAGGTYLALSIQFRLPVPVLFGDLALMLGAGLMGHSIARIAGLRDGRNIRLDFLYTLLIISIVYAAYVSASVLSYWVYGIPLVALIFVLMLAVISHSAYDWARTTLDRFFFQKPTRLLRANLRALAHEAGSGHDLRGSLRSLLAALCHSLGAARGALLLRKDGQFVFDAVYRMSAQAQPVPPGVLAADEMVALSAPTVLGEMALLVPLRLMGQQEGAVVLGPREGGGTYTESDEDLVADAVDQMESVLAQIRLQEERTRALNEQVVAFRQKEREWQRPVEPVQEGSIAVPGFAEAEFVAHVEDALRHITDITFLGEHALCGLGVVSRRLNGAASTHLDRGRALKEVLLDALNGLRPSASPEPVYVPLRESPPGGEWYPYLILRDEYLVGVPNREIMARLYISEGTFNRTRRRAVRAVARVLADMERQAVVRQEGRMR